MQEVWKDVTGYEGLYQVSNLGRVRSLDGIVVQIIGSSTRSRRRKGRVLKPSTNIHGRLGVNLWKDKKPAPKNIHRLVAISFIPNPYNFPEVNHKDENPKNNHVDNLEWCTREYNINYGTLPERLRKHYNARIKKVICLDTLEIFNSAKEAGNKLNIYKDTISNVCRGKHQRAGGYRFMYYNEWIKEEIS